MSTNNKLPVNRIRGSFQGLVASGIGVEEATGVLEGGLGTLYDRRRSQATPGLAS
jgi:hypothetical protein